MEYTHALLCIRQGKPYAVVYIFKSLKEATYAMTDARAKGCTNEHDILHIKETEHIGEEQ